MDKAIFVLIFAALSYVIYIVIMPRLTAEYCKRILENPNNYDNNLVSKLLRASYSGRQIFRSLSLPVPGKDGEEIRVGTVVVNRLGVYIICQIHGGGLVDNAPRQNWNHMTGGKCTEFANPFQSQEEARELISFYAKNYGIGDIKVHSLVIYTNGTLKFTQGQNRSIVNAINLNRKLRTLDKMGRLNMKQVRLLCRMLSDLNEGVYL